MRAAQHDVVGARFQHRIDAAMDQRFHLRTVQDAFFHRFDQAFPHALDDLHIAGKTRQRVQVEPSLEGAGGGQYPDHTAAAAQDGGLDGGLHADERDAIVCAQVGNGCRGGRIAGHDNEAAALFEEEVGDGAGTFHDEGGVLRPVGTEGCIRKIDIIFVRHQPDQFPPDGQTAHA